MGTKIGRLVVADYGDPGRLVGAGVERFARYAARRGVRVTTVMATR